MGFLVLVTAEISAAQSWEKAELLYQIECEKLAKVRGEAKGALQRMCLERLKVAEAQYRADGAAADGDRVAEEIKLIGRDGVAPPYQSTAKTRAIHAIYSKKLSEIEKRWAGGQVAISKRISEIAEKSDAGGAKQFLEELTMDPLAKAVRELDARLELAGARAYRLERDGDFLEVIVFFDDWGAISWESPVRTTRKPGARSGRRATTAAVLGEFLGAPGYSVDPFVIDYPLPRNPSKRELERFPKVRTNGFDTEREVKVDGKKGTGFSINHPSANVSADFDLTAVIDKQQDANYRFSCEYFLDTENETVEQLVFTHSSNVKTFLLADRTITGVDSAGEWQVFQASGVVKNRAERHGVFYVKPFVPNGKPRGSVAGDTFYLRDIKVELMNFSARIHEKFAPGDNRMASGEKIVFDELAAALEDAWPKPLPPP